MNNNNLPPPEVIARMMVETNEAFQRAAQMAPDPRTKEWLVDVPPYDAEGVIIERFKITEAEANHSKLRAAFNSQRGDRSVDAGTYTRLTVDDAIEWMTDTPAEIRDHLPVDEAMRLNRHGSMLIVGLGLGVVLNRAICKHCMSMIDVVEIDDRILLAVGGHYLALAQHHGVELRFHHADIHTWQPPRRSYWDVGWFDIWATINDDDMAEVKRLRDRFRRRLGWFGAWAQDERVAMKRRLASGKWAY